MKHLETYFSKDGISSSQANHVCNLVKEHNKVVAAELDQAAAYSETMAYGNQTIFLKNPATVDFAKLAVKEGELYALSAWLREAIKARETLLTYYRNCPITVFAEFYSWPNGEAPAVPRQNAVPVPVKATEADILETFSIKDLSEYWALEAKAAHIGKRIHKGGIIAQVREDLIADKQKITSFQKVDDKSYVVTYAPLYSLNQTNQVFNDLQKLHREYESRLNWYKARIQNGISELDAERQGKYKAELDKEAARYREEAKVYHDLMTGMQNSNIALSAENEQKRALKLREISAWKIAIPDDLKSVYQQFAE